MKVKSKRIAWDARRSIIISDIHAHRALLERLLEKCEYDVSQDHLIILGDMVEKGAHSLDTLHLIMDLAKRGKVDVVMGNCEAIALQVMNGYDWKGLCHYLYHAPWRHHMLLWEMAERCGVKIPEDGDPAPAFAQILKSFEKEFAFLADLPHVLSAKDCILVHAGLKSERPPYAQDAYELMKYDFFGREPIHFQKLVICGHTPIFNYHEGIPSARPYLDDDKNIFFIDGGCGVREDGQLNALIYENGVFHSLYVDELPKGMVISEDYDWEEQYTYSISECCREVTKRRRVNDGWDCFHLNYRREIWVPDEYLYECDGRWFVRDYSNYHPQLRIGDEVSVINQRKDELYVKCNGINGWVKASNIKIKK